MIKADKYLKETIYEILEEGQWDKNPRTHWADGTPAHSKFVTQKVFQYDISKGEFPINTLRTTALKGAFHDIEAIYIKQVNYLEAMHSSIYSWWKDFSWREKFCASGIGRESYINTIGKTYGDTVKRYKLVDKLLNGLEENTFGRRHKISLWQEQQVIDDPKALEPCAGLTFWSVRDYDKFEVNKRYLDITLMQRSMDLAVTSSINPAQYVMFAMMVCNHLTFKTGIKHEVGKLLHVVQNCHIYDRHLDSAKEVLKRKPTKLQPKIELICEPKDFYSHIVEDFKFTNLEDIKALTKKLEIAI
jgi:thymidylate synthase